MNKILLIVMLLLANQFPLQARENFYGLRYDYMLHFTISSMSSVCIVQWEKSEFFGTNLKEDYGILSVGIPITAGIIKEFIDNKGPFFRNKESWYDLTAGVLGSLFGKFLTYTF